MTKDFSKLTTLPEIKLNSSRAFLRFAYDSGVALKKNNVSSAKKKRLILGERLPILRIQNEFLFYSVVILRESTSIDMMNI